MCMYLCMCAMTHPCMRHDSLEPASLGGLDLCMYVRMYVCENICCVRMCVCVCAWMWALERGRASPVYERKYACVYVRAYVCVFLCLYFHTFVCWYVRVEWVSVWVGRSVCEYIRSLWRIMTYARMYMCIYMCVCIMFVCLFVCLFVCMFVCMYVYMYVCLYVRGRQVSM